MGTSALGRICSHEDVEIFRQEVLGVVGQYNSFVVLILDVNQFPMFHIFLSLQTSQAKKPQ
jgi:hypothetical protein